MGDPLWVDPQARTHRRLLGARHNVQELLPLTREAPGQRPRPQQQRPRRGTTIGGKGAKGAKGVCGAGVLLRAGNTPQVPQARAGVDRSGARSGGNENFNYQITERTNERTLYLI